MTIVGYPTMVEVRVTRVVRRCGIQGAAAEIKGSPPKRMRPDRISLVQYKIYTALSLFLWSAIMHFEIGFC